MSELNTDVNILVEEPKKKKGKAIGIIIGFTLVIGIAIGFYFYLEAQKQKALEEYNNNLNIFLTAAYTTGVTAENIVNAYTDVWHSAIWDDYAEIDGERYYDFNDALTAQYSLFKEAGLLDTFDESFQLANKSMNKLDNPPAEFEREYEAANDLSDSLNDFVSLANNPSGNYNTFSSESNEKDAQMASDLQKLDNLLSN